MLEYFRGKEGSQIPMLQDSDIWEGGIKKGQKNSDVFYGRPLRSSTDDKTSKAHFREAIAAECQT